MQKFPISLELACEALPELWSPRVVGQVNDQFVKVARVQGEFPWHAHAREDELFLVLRGCLRIGRGEADGGDVDVRAGEFFDVPRGVRHNTSAAEETWIALIETVSTEHTGGEEETPSLSFAGGFGGGLIYNINSRFGVRASGDRIGAAFSLRNNSTELGNSPHRTWNSSATIGVIYHF